MFGHQDEPAQSTTSNQPTVEPATDTSASSSFGAIPAPTTDTNYLLDAQADDGQTGAPEVGAVEVPAPAAVAPTPTTTPAGGPDALLDLKQQALQQLSPLVGQLEQTAEEKFRTTMMLIQASDNQDLLHTAYDAANKIADEKARAQALLDVINEINYFSQSKDK
jgi:hypothetical protein